MKKINGRRCLATALMLASSVPVCALAQTETGETTVDDVSVGEIVVTANKRSESLNKVGLTVTAATGEALANLGVSSVADLSKIVPGLTFTQSANATPVYTLRGVGFYESSLGIYPAVTVYQDQVPLTFPAVTAQGLGLDQQRVEVLKGPQGTVFGQNSTGGAINYVANRPTDRFEAGGEIGVGRFAQVEGQAYVSGPLSDTVRARVAVRGERADDWQYSYTRDDAIGRKRNLAGRVLIDAEPTENLTLQLSASGWIDKGDPTVGQYSHFNPQFGDDGGLSNNYDALVNYPLAPAKARAADWSPEFRPRKNENMYMFSLRGDLKLNEDLTLTSVTSYAHYRRRDIAADDGVNRLANDLTKNNGSISDFYQEMRLASSDLNDFTWTVGGAYARSNVREDLANIYEQTTSTYFLNFSQTAYFSDQDMSNWAVFGSGKYRLTDALSLKGGMRYTEVKRDISTCLLDPNQDRLFGAGAVARFFQNIARSVTGDDSIVVPPGGCVTLDAEFRPGIYEGSLNEHNLSWQAGIDYEISRDTLLYANVSRGYKAGSFPTVAATFAGQIVPVTQESVTAYEAGFKTSMAGRSLFLTGAAFWYDYKDKQLRGKAIFDPFGLLDVLQNVPKSRIRGAEATLSWNPAPGLNLGLSGTYLDAKILEYTGYTIENVETNFAGAAIPLTPRWSGSANIDYTFDFASGHSLTVGGNLTAQSRTIGAVGSDPVTREVYDMKPYAVVDLRATVKFPDDAVSVGLWVRNLTNKYYWNSVVTNYDTTVRYAAMPRTFGVRGTFKFR